MCATSRSCLDGLTNWVLPPTSSKSASSLHRPGGSVIANGLRAEYNSERDCARLVAWSDALQARRRVHQRRTLPLTPGSRRPARCAVRSEPDPPALARARCAEQSDGLDGPQARPCDIVDEYLREDRPR